jgi:hypothetical protein
MKFTAIGILLLTISLYSLSQSNKDSNTMNALFCGKIGESGPIGGYYTFEELNKCDWKIFTLDTNYVVVEFRLAIVPKDSAFKYSEERIKGNTIPEKFRSRILSDSKATFLEYIRAVNGNGEQISVTPIAIRIIK